MKEYTIHRRTPFKFAQKGYQGMLFEGEKPTGIYVLEPSPYERSLSAAHHYIVRRDNEGGFIIDDIQGYLVNSIQEGSSLKDKTIRVGMAATNLFGMKYYVWGSRQALDKMYDEFPNRFILRVKNA